MLERTLEELAHQTWSSMELARYGLLFTPEEKHFTDHNIIEISRRHRPRVFATRSRIREHSTGADFEWWIRDGSDVIGLLVQAKRLSFNGFGVYEDIDRRTDDGSPQPNRLIATAATDRMTPLYVFYNGPVAQFPRGPCGGSIPLPSRGCTITAAEHVAVLAAAGSNASLADVQKTAIPWQCLLTCPLAMQLVGSMPRRVERVLDEYGMLPPHSSAVIHPPDIPERVGALFTILDRQVEARASESLDETAPEDLIAAATEGAVAKNIVGIDVSDDDIHDVRAQEPQAG